MSEGYLYILFNPSFRPGQFKIGKTTKTPAIRARDLSAATGVPEPFEVIYEERVVDCHLAESLVHATLSSSRTASGKEFFSVELKDAVRAIEKAADEVGRVQSTEDEPTSNRGHESRSSQPTATSDDRETDVEPPEKAKASSAHRSREQREYLRFWTELLERINAETDRFRHIRPTTYYHRTMMAYRPKVDFYFTLNKKSLRVELFIATADGVYNKEVFSHLSNHRAAIEAAFGEPLIWQQHKKDCGIKHQVGAGDYRRQEHWEALTRDALSSLLRLEAALVPYLKDAV